MAMFDDLLGMDEPHEEGSAAPSLPRASEMPVPAPDSAISIDDATPRDLLNAQAGTAHWLEALGGVVGDQSAPPPALDDAARAAARSAFCSITNPYVDPLEQKARLMALSAPPAVRHLAGMLSEYDWEYVKQAKEIRGYIVARLLEHAKSTDPKISLAALKALGTVAEVGAFVERIEVTRPAAETTPDAVIDRLRQRLNGMLPLRRSEMEAAAANAAGVEDAVVVNATA